MIAPSAVLRMGIPTIALVCIILTNPFTEMLFYFDGTGYRFDTEPGRVLYFYHDPERFWKYVRPVKRG